MVSVWVCFPYKLNIILFKYILLLVWLVGLYANLVNKYNIKMFSFMLFSFKFASIKRKKV